jgi:hypothetical protein
MSLFSNDFTIDSYNLLTSKTKDLIKLTEASFSAGNLVNSRFLEMLNLLEVCRLSFFIAGSSLNIVLDRGAFGGISSEF